MDDLNKKRSSRQARQHGGAPNNPQAATDTQAAAPGKSDADMAGKNGTATAPHGDVPGSNGQLASAIAEAVKNGNGADAKDAAARAGDPLGTSGAGGLPARTEAANAPDGAGAPAPEIVRAPASRKRVKAVRASFTLPKDDHATLAALKDACRGQDVKAKRSQLLRVAIGLLRDVEPARLAGLVAALPPTGSKRK